MLEQAKGLGVQIFQIQITQILLHAHHVGDAPQEERIDARKFMNMRCIKAAAKALCHVEDALGARACDLGLKLCAAHLGIHSSFFARGSQADMTIFQAAQRFGERLLKGAPDRHHFAHCLHASGERIIGALELLEREARYLHHAVVDGRLEACRRDARDIVHDLVERVAYSQFRSGFRDGKAGRLRGER